MARLFFGLFISCSLLYSCTSRPSRSIPAGNQPNQRENQLHDDGNQSNKTAADHKNGNRGSHVGGDFGNEILMKVEQNTLDKERAMKYMYEYGYMEVPNNPVFEIPKMTSAKMKESIKKMQMMMGMPMTGELDTLTMMMIEMPRCGVQDPADRMVVHDKGVYHQAEETISDILMHRHEKWPRNNITYRMLNFPTNLNRNDAHTAIQQAFKLWSDVTPLTFTEKIAGYADIYLKFGRYEHGDYQPFDGRGGTLAHAFLPGSNNGDFEGDIHFDDSEQLTFRSNQGNDLFKVAAHEIGHALGLEHSTNRRALMSPFIQPFDPQFNLHSEDVAHIQDLYGLPAKPQPMLSDSVTTDVTQTTSKSTSVTQSPSTTTSSGMKTTSEPVINHNTFPTYDNSVESSYEWDYSASSSDYSNYDEVRSCKPYVSFFDRENGIEDHTAGSGCNFTFDAVTSYKGEIFAFKNNRYWRITRENGLISPLEGSSTTIFEAFPDNIDAAYETYLTSKLLVFKGSDYFIYDDLSLESGPLPITNLDHTLPNDIDAVLSWGEFYKTYFFKGDQVWRYDELHGRVDEGCHWSINQIWTGVPDNLTSAFRWGDYTNFLQGNRLFEYDDYCYYVNPTENPKTFVHEHLNGNCPSII